mmetsp:Transcript_4135/g.9385  ORF Transcript_4135/g.9385 Transcript_4135/m.9385 type:complete len:331 (+) Transcript_4135:30-1022(+)
MADSPQYPSSASASGNSGAAGEAADSTPESITAIAALPPILSIWDCERIKKIIDDKGSKIWKCGWCKCSFRQHNATKAVAHVAKQKGAHIAKCTAKIPEGKSYTWHEKYSLPYTKVLGYVACRTTSKILGIGAAERAWGDVKTLKTDKRSHLSADKTEKQAIIYTSAKVNEARILQQAMEKIDAKGKDAMWGDDDLNFDLGLERWGVDVDELKEMGVPKRIFRGWIEDWEKDILKKDDAECEALLLEKYKGLTFYDLDYKITYTAYEKQLHYQKGRGGGWCVFGVPPDDEGEDEPYLINNNLIEMILETPQPKHLNVEIVKKDSNNSNEE